MRKKKIFAIALYFTYAIALTLLLIFGANVSHWVTNIVDKTLNRKEIVDVTVNVGDGAELLANRDLYLKFTAHGDFVGDPGLKFTSLNPDNVVVTSTGVVYSNLKFEGDYLDAKIKVNSKYDDDFEKIFTFRFVKKLPDEFIAAYYVKGYGHGIRELQVGVPVYVFSHTEQKSGYNVIDFDLEYDEEYFALADDGALVPIKPTPEGVELSAKVIYYNGRYAETTPFVIIESTGPVTEIDEIRFNNIGVDEFVGTRKKSSVITLYNNGERVMTDYTIEVDDPDDVVFSAASHISFLSAGDKRVTFTLPNGFSKTVTVKIRNVITLPTIEGIDADTEVVNMAFSEVKTFNMSFPNTVTYYTIKYQYDTEMLSITSNERKFTISPKRSGEHTVTMTIDDGFDSVTRTIIFNVEKSPNIIATITKNVAKFVAKIMGHVALFALLGILSMNMFKYLGIYKTYLRLTLYCLCGLPVGAITEYAQTFIPGRTGRVQDVLIDMAGFAVGTLFVIVLRIILSRRSRQKREREYREKIKARHDKNGTGYPEPVFE